MVKLLEAKYGPLKKVEWPIDEDVKVEIDAATEDRSVMIEIFARQGKLNDGQKKKIAKDVLKLALIGAGDGPKPRTLILPYANPSITKHITRESWLARAATKFGIKTECLFDKLPDALKEQIQQAQKIQGERFRKDKPTI